uniref:Rho guanine nucleotide exchange factor 26 n=1 Tax=Salmo trutta TaxID=8032 RepID=A0A674C3S9_SALTR
MEGGNEVDLSNNNISPLWKRHSANHTGPSQPKARPLSYQIDRLHMTDFPVEDSKCSFTLSQPRPRDALKRLSSPFTLTSHKDQIVFGTSSSLPDPASSNHPSPPATPNNNHHHNQTSPSSYHPLTPSPSHSSTCSISSLTSTSTPSDPPTPRSPSPADMSSPSLSPPPSIVLSTHSAAALKMGTQQLIPKGLASLSKASPAGVQSQGLGGLLGGEGTDQDESPGSLKRGLRSTSYRRAVVSGVEMEVPSVDPKSHRLSQPSVLKGLQEVKETPTSPGKKNKVGTDEELYQNYQEKALHNDSDEDQSREPKPDDGIVVQYRPIRTSWSQLSVVKKSGIKLSQEERKRQEAIFELISSEHSYLHSLEVLIRMFQNSGELSDTMTKTEHHHLFSNITDVCDASKKFFKELEDMHQQNVVIDDISDIVFRHAQSNFDPYITYCSNEVYQQRTLQRLISKSPVFKEVLTRIEGHPDCRNLPMISFLILPMQRVTRLPLLMDVICQKASKGSSQYEACKKALQSVSKVVRKCNEGARTMERTEMMYTINSQLDFKIKPFPLVSSSRWMVKRGELTAFVEENGIFSKRTSRHQVYFFLFNDVLILTRKKSEDSYAVIDYALRDHIWVGPCQAQDINLSPVRTTAGMLTSRHPGASHLFRLRFRSNHSGDKVPMVLGVELMNERARWITALGQSSNDEKNQDRTNAMQVVVTRTYTAKQPDELSLQVADVVLVAQTVEDGWYEGERLRDGERGWFLSECAEPITCQATIERNMQRMDRLQGLETNV